jgi:carbon-monoxide dehydrogenase large subunit
MLPRSELDRTVPTPTVNPMGAKGAGEAGTIASTPAVVNAVVDALRQFGVHDIQMPCTPERVWRGIHSGDGAEETEGAAAPHFTEETGMQGQTDRTDGASQ